jgi:hypothetical protein
LIKASSAPFRGGQQKIGNFGRSRLEAFDGLGAANFAQRVHKFRPELHPVTVRIDHGMIQSRAQVTADFAIACHDSLSEPVMDGRSTLA